MIQFADMRIGAEYSWTENFSSALNLFLASVFFTFPVLILRLYFVEMDRADPLPDLHPDMTKMELQRIYGS